MFYKRVKYDYWGWKLGSFFGVFDVVNSVF